MLVDWFTVIAQVINFLILVLLLRKFLYKPVLRAIEAREKKIAAQIRDAESQKAEAAKQKEEFRLKNESIQQASREMLAKAEQEAGEERKRLMEETKKEAAALQVQLRDMLSKEEERLRSGIVRFTTSEVFALSRKIFSDLADTNVQQKMVDVFIRRLNSLDSEERNRLRSELRLSPDASVIIKSGFPLSAGQREAVSSFIKSEMAPDAELQFSEEPERITGIELAAKGYKVAWSVEEYLSVLEKSVTALLNEIIESGKVPEQESKLHEA